MMMYKISISSLIKIKKDRYEKRMMEVFIFYFYTFPFYGILFFKYFYVFVHLCIACDGSPVLCGLFSGRGEWGLSSLLCLDFSLQWPLVLQSTGSGCGALAVAAHGLSSCGPQASEQRLNSWVPWAQLLGSMGDPGSGNPVSCIGRWILYH